MAPMLHVLYLVHDFCDPAAGRRVAMLQAGGASVTLAGFRRRGQDDIVINGLRPIDLGRTHDGKFVQRLAAIARAGLALGDRFRNIRRPDIIIARNLEMLALARHLRRHFSHDIPIAYECLDIHRLLLRSDAIGMAMRMAEHRLARQTALLITSSPAFIREYFEPRGQIDTPMLLLENKVLELAEKPRAVPAQPPQPGEPWQIGWFGALRCRRSLALLGAFTRRMEGRFQVILRGRPAYSEFEDFDATVAAEPYLSFLGPYRNPGDLADIYGSVHFSWAIDFFEEGLNSSWLLPNRLYEGCHHGAIPVAMEGTETARFLQREGIGLVLPEPSAGALSVLFSSMDAVALAEQRARIAAKSDHVWTSDRKDCRALVARLKSLCGAGSVDAIMETSA
jgi:succinoglycan biosynthesis protein ExoL